MNPATRTRLSSVSMMIAIAATLAFTVIVPKSEGGTLQVSPNGDIRETIVRAIDGLRAPKSFRMRQVFSGGDSPFILFMEVAKPDRSHCIQNDSEETIFIGDKGYQRKGKGPWINFTDGIIAISVVQSDINIHDQIKRIGQVKFLGTDTLDGVAVLAYEYEHIDASGRKASGPYRIWIGKEDGLPYRTESETQTKAAEWSAKPGDRGLITIKVVTTYSDYNADIIIDLPEKPAREAAEFWLQLVDSGRYSDSWVGASGLLKERYSEETWKKRLSEFAKQARNLTPIKSRNLASLESVKSLPSLDDREGVELTYRAYLEKPGSVLQRLELVLETDQVWRVANYTELAPPPIPTRDAVPEPRLEPRVPSSVGPGSGGGLRNDGARDGPATSVDSRPIALNSPAPRYTEEARNNKIQGTVTVRVLVGADGQVKQVRVVRGLPDGLNEQAIQAAYQLRFKPAMKGGVPVAFWQSVTIEFNLGK